MKAFIGFCGRWNAVLISSSQTFRSTSGGSESEFFVPLAMEIQFTRFAAMRGNTALTYWFWERTVEQA